MMTEEEKKQHIHILRWAKLGEGVICVHDRCGFELSRQELLENYEKVRALELAILNIKDALLKEIKWCRDNQNSEETQKAFIAGLEQAQRLVNAAQETLLMDERYGEGFLVKL